MKLKVVILASSLIISLTSLAEEVQKNWQYKCFPNSNTRASTRYAETKEEAIYLATQIFPVYSSNGIDSKYFYDKTELIQYLSTNRVTGIGYETIDLGESFNITNVVTGEYIPYDQIYGPNSKASTLLRQAIVSSYESSLGLYSILKENSLYYANTQSGKQRLHIRLSAVCYNLLTSSESAFNSLIINNLDIIKGYLTEIGYNSSELLVLGDAIESNQIKQLEHTKFLTNLVRSISINSSYAVQHLESIKTVAKTFAQDQRIKQLASGQIFSTLNPLDEGDDGVIYEALDQLVRLNMLKQGVNITESELNTMSTSDKWTKSGMAAKYGSYSDNYDNRNIGIIVGTEAIKENENFQNKVNTLSQLADDNGNVIDPLTGELTKLTNAIKDWDKGKVDGAIASYQYNNPAATNGFFGEIKRTLTEEGDWRLLDKGFKEKQESFMDNLTQDGVKINTGTGPVAVTVNNDDGLIVNFPDEVFQSKIFKTSNSTLDIWYDKWIDWKILWSNFTGVENHNDRGFLDIMLERNDLYYSYVTNKMYGTVSNQLARLIELNDYTNRQNFVDVPRATYVRYLMRGIGTTENNDDDLFAIKDEPTFAFDGSTNFEQAVAFQLHDLFEVSQNGSKADMMTADFIRGIYQLLGTGSNIAVQVAYITNTVYKANGLSTDKNDYSSYDQEKEKLEADLEEVNTILEDMQSEVKEKINYVSVRLFADYTLPKSVTLLEFNNQKFEIDLYKWSKIFDMMHMCSQVAWLAVGLLMLPRVIYMLLCFGLKMLGRFYNIMRS